VASRRNAIVDSAQRYRSNRLSSCAQSQDPPVHRDDGPDHGSAGVEPATARRMTRSFFVVPGARIERPPQIGEEPFSWPRPSRRPHPLSSSCGHESPLWPDGSARARNLRRGVKRRLGPARRGGARWAVGNRITGRARAAHHEPASSTAGIDRLQRAPRG